MYRYWLIAGCILGFLLNPVRVVAADASSGSSRLAQVSAATAYPVHDQSAAGDAPLTAERERALQPRDRFSECKNCPAMVVVPSGSFEMGPVDSEEFRFLTGASSNAPGSGSDKSLQHMATIEKPFAISPVAVTFDEWDACVADHGCAGYTPLDEGWGRGPRPVINVSWDDVQSYLTWLSHKTGKTYRLPSEAEFEYVARAGSKTAFPWGAEIGNNIANCDGCGRQLARAQSATASPLVANAFGIYDPSRNPCGQDLSLRSPPCNVWEWVEDCDHGNAHGDDRGAPADGSPSANSACRNRVIRGGVWYYYPQFLRSSYRGAFAASYRNYFLGFRVARTLLP